MGVSPYIAGLRERVGHDLLLLPSVTVLCEDADGRILLVRQRDTGQWATVGGFVEPDEDPRAAAIREAKEEAGVDVELLGILEVLGGPEFRVTYPNGDETAYVTTVYAARVVGGRARPDMDETVEIAWLARDELGDAELGAFARASLVALGRLPS